MATEETTQEVEVEPTGETVEQTVETPAAETTPEVSTPEAQVSDVEATLASEALEQAPGETAPAEATAPLGVVHGLRAKGREKDQTISALQQLNDNLRTELDNRAKAPDQVSPLEKYGSENPDVQYGEVPVDVHVAERKWQEQQDQNKATTQAVDQQQARGRQSLKTAQETISDFDDVVAMGQKYLTEGNQHDIRTSADPAALLYKLSMRATLDSGTADAQVLRQHLQSKLTKPTVPKSKPKEQTEEVPETEEQVPDNEPMSPRLAQTYAMLGM